MKSDNDTIKYQNKTYKSWTDFVSFTLYKLVAFTHNSKCTKSRFLVK